MDLIKRIFKTISNISQGYHNQLRHIDGLKYTTVVQKQRLIMLRRYSDTASTVHSNVQLQKERSVYDYMAK